MLSIIRRWQRFFCSRGKGNNDRQRQPAITQALESLASDADLQLLLERILSSDVYGPGMQILEVLGRVNGKRGLALLLRALEDERVSVRLSACRALGLTFQGRASSRPSPPESLFAFVRAENDLGVNPEALEALLRTADDDNQDVAAEALEALSYCEDPRVVPALLRKVADPEDRVRSSAIRSLSRVYEPELVPVLMRSLCDDVVQIRVDSIRALRKYKERSTIPALVRLLCDWDCLERHSPTTEAKPVSREAAISLDKLKWEPTNEAERIHFWSAMGYSGKLRRSWESTVKVLVSDLESGNRQQVSGAVISFIGAGHSQAIPILLEILERSEDRLLAEAYLNSRHGTLESAARDWAQLRGFVVERGKGFRPVTWRGMKAQQ